MSGPRFSGGEGLEPGSAERYVHDFMMLNELRNGEGAYEISSAQRGTSGLSFGPYQWDIGANAHGRALLETIATDAVDENGRRFVSDEDIERLRAHLYKPVASFTEADAAVRAELVPRLDAALSSPRGIELVNADFVAKLPDKIAAMDRVVEQVADSTNRDAIQSNWFVKLNVVDIQNQYGTAVNRTLGEALNLTEGSGQVTLPDRRKGGDFAVQGQWGVEEAMRFRMETWYAATRNDATTTDALRRVSNLVSVVGVENIPLDEDDRRYLVSGLPAQLREHGRDPALLEAASLEPLRALSERALSESPELQQWVRDNPTAELTMGNPLSDGTLEKGEKGQAVEALQVQLDRLGYTNKSGESLAPDGDFGGGTEHAVESFQTDRQLPVTGIADEATRKEVDRAVTESLRDAPLDPQESPRLRATPESDSHRIDDALYGPVRDQVYAMDRSLGRTPDEASDRVAAALVAEWRTDQARGAIDGVVLGQKGTKAEPGEYVFAYSGSPERPNDFVGVRTADAVQTPVEHSLGKAQEAVQRQALEAQQVALAQQQTADGPRMTMG